MQSDDNHLTVFDCLCLLFPRRSAPEQRVFEQWPAAAPPATERTLRFALKDDALRLYQQHYSAPPIFPFDLFAITGYLLENSGAYHHVVPALEPQRPRTADRAHRVVRIGRKTLADCRRMGRRWRRMTQRDGEAERGLSKDEVLKRRQEVIDRLTDLWHRLFAQYGNAPIFTSKKIVSEDGKNTAPRWWFIALQLFIIADEAAESFGTLPIHKLTDKDETSFALAQPIINFKNDFQKSMKDWAAAPDQTRSTIAIPPLTTLSVARQDIVAVVPKARTTPVGCTLRSLSHHLALLPARGVARANWVPHIFAQGPAPEMEFNLLLVPYPFSIAPHDFRGQTGLVGSRQAAGLFTIEQTWLQAYRGTGMNPDMAERILAVELTNFICDLAKDARTTHRANDIHALVFPEMALNHRVFLMLQEKLQGEFASLELFVAGLSEDETGRKGNFVAVSTFSREEKSKET